jgi:hypothetical protein
MAGAARTEESAQTALALARLAETNPGHAKETLALRTAGVKDANPAAAQEQLYSKPPHAVSRWRVNPRHRVPAVSPRDNATAGPVH